MTNVYLEDLIDISYQKMSLEWKKRQRPAMASTCTVAPAATTNRRTVEARALRNHLAHRLSPNSSPLLDEATSLLGLLSFWGQDSIVNYEAFVEGSW